MNRHVNNRGAAKHWLIGCGGCLVIVIIIIAGVAWWGWEKIGKNFEMFSVANKTDPPVTASATDIFPQEVGKFKLDPAARPEMAQAVETTGTHVAVYISNSDRVEVQATLTTMAGDNPPPGMPNMPRQNVGIDEGMYMPMGKMVDVGMWSRKNWTFVVMSRGAVAKDFVKKFNPGGGPLADEDDTYEAEDDEATTTTNP